MPKKATKRLQKVADNAVRIRCRYCEIKDSCSRRAVKEVYEAEGYMTYCSLTPNTQKKKRK